MDIKDVRSARKELELEMLYAATEACRKFRDKTGISVERIDIRMGEISQISDEEKRFEPFFVDAHVSI